jgi:hypothetical protein
LFATNPRCRQPFVAMVLAVLSVLLAVGAFILAGRLHKPPPSEVNTLGLTK